MKFASAIRNTFMVDMLGGGGGEAFCLGIGTDMYPSGILGRINCMVIRMV